jgi:N-acetylmuramoyl-L-alanine amidase
MNSASIGVEIANGGHAFGLPPFPEEQIAAVVALCQDLLSRRAIARDRVLAHSDIAPSRKRDPGEAFPWRRLCAAGVAEGVEPEPIREDVGLAEGDEGPGVAAFQRGLAAYGYDCAATGRYDAATATIVQAFQRRFRAMRVDGAADRSTVETLRRLLGPQRAQAMEWG